MTLTALVPSLSNVIQPANQREEPGDVSFRLGVYWSGAILIGSYLLLRFFLATSQKHFNRRTQTTRWFLLQPCRTFHRTNRWYPSLFIYFSNKALGRLLWMVFAKLKTLVSVFHSTYPKELSLSVQYCTVYIYNRKGTKKDIEYFICCMKSVNFHLYFQFLNITLEFKFNILYYVYPPCFCTFS